MLSIQELRLREFSNLTQTFKSDCNYNPVTDDAHYRIIDAINRIAIINKGDGKNG